MFADEQDGQFPSRWWQRAVTRFAATRPGAWLFSHLAHRVDGAIIRRTGGRHSLTAWLTSLPVVTLTTTGARSGLPRTVPLLAIPDGPRVVLIASNFGRSRHPAWYRNLLAHPEATLAFDGRNAVYAAREATEAERQAYWDRAVARYAGYAAYEQRTGGRRIPIMVLTPKG
jgi:deazaflavin-dependent oxidoreductase (nitroreductase family)